MKRKIGVCLIILSIILAALFFLLPSSFAVNKDMSHQTNFPAYVSLFPPMVFIGFLAIGFVTSNPSLINILIMLALVVVLLLSLLPLIIILLIKKKKRIGVLVLCILVELYTIIASVFTSRLWFVYIIISTAITVLGIIYYKVSLFDNE